MTFHIVTLFPKMFDSYLSESILKRAIEDKKISVKFYNPRDYTKGTWRRVDQKPYGGGPGMVLQSEPVIKAVEAALRQAQDKRSKKTKVIFFSPAGKQFDTSYAKTTAKKFTDIIFICGRYEGVDARVKKIFKAEEVSVGPYVLTGGELPAMVMVDCISRQIKGVLGDFASLEESRVSSSDVYTRPAILKYKNKKYLVPKILLSGHHEKIDEWRKGK